MDKGGVSPLQKERGFTLISTLVSFSIFLIIVSLFPQAFLLWTNGVSMENTFYYEEFVIFAGQLQADFRKSQQYWTNDRQDRLYFDRPSDMYIVHYELYQNKIRRQVRGLGHEVFLQEVSSFHVEETTYGVLLEVTANDLSYKRVLTHPPSYIPTVVARKKGDLE